MSPIYRIHAYGPYALFNQPAFRSERISSLVPSHSAAVALPRGICGHKALDWIVLSLTLQSKPMFHPMLHNELNFDSNSPNKPIFIEEARTQRTSVYLRDYDCIIEAQFKLSSKAGPEDNIPKFDQMFRDRLRMGVERRRIYFGTSECKCYLEAAEGPATPVDIDSDFGLMFYDVDWDDPETPYYFAPLTMVHGVVRYPSWDVVRKMGIMRLNRRSA